MAVRLRKIKQPKTVAKIAQDIDRKEVLWVRIRKLSIFLILLTLAAVIYYLFFADTTGIVLIRGEVYNISSPVTAKVKWIIQGDKQIEPGTKIAVLNEVADNTVSSRHELEKKKAELIHAAYELNDIKTRITDFDSRQKMKEIELNTAVKLAETAMERGKNKTTKAKKIYEARKAELERAKRLWNLDALTESDLSAAKRMFTDAETAYKNALIFNTSLKDEYNAALKSLNAYKQKSTDQKKALLQLLKSSREYYTFTQKQISHITQLINGRCNEDIIINSPVGGRIMPLTTSQGELLRKDGLIGAVYQPDKVEIIAYVPEKFKDSVQNNQEVTVRIGDRLIKGQVSAIKPQIVLAPPVLRIRGLAARNAYFFIVHIKTERTNLKGLFPGQTGKVIFK